MGMWKTPLNFPKGKGDKRVLQKGACQTGYYFDRSHRQNQCARGSGGGYKVPGFF
jgi:hypothetical protein